jgi:hypothetical protein
VPAGDFSILRNISDGLRHTQLPIHWVPGLFAWGRVARALSCLLTLIQC